MFKKNFISPLFIAFCILLAFGGNLEYFLIYFLVVAIHEFAHFFVSKKLGYKLSKFYIMPYGVCLNYSNDVFWGNDEIFIALAGPMINLFLCLVCVALWWCFPETYYTLDYFCFCNLVLALFNLLPCFPLDGGRVLTAVLSKKYERQKIMKYTFIINYIICFLLLTMFFIELFNKVNLTYLYVAVFLFSGTINPEKYSQYNYISSSLGRRQIKSGTAVKLIATNDTTPLYKIMAKFSKNKFNVAYVVLSTGEVRVLSEINIDNLAIKYSPVVTISEILYKKTSIKLN